MKRLVCVLMMAAATAAGVRALPAQPELSSVSESEHAPVSRSARLIGDDDGDGRIDEDESGWDPRSMVAR